MVGPYGNLGTGWYAQESHLLRLLRVGIIDDMNALVLLYLEKIISVGIDLTRVSGWP